MSSEFSRMQLNDYVEALGSGAPTPGGGGASALVGALGIALGNMVAHLTIGKKRYASVELDMLDLKSKADNLQAELVTLIERDAEVFEPLAKAYSMPKDTEEEKAAKEEVMEKALKEACSIPLQIMEKVCASIDLIAEAAQKGAVSAVSDAGDAAAFCRAALQGASLNVYINTRSMKNRELAQMYNRRAEEMLETYVPRADEIFASVRDRLKN
jgi:formiminotetrahydrofolate cyclodeaminase